MPAEPEDALGLPPGAFARIDDTDDALFYEPPRLVGTSMTARSPR